MKLKDRTIKWQRKLNMGKCEVTFYGRKEVPLDRACNFVSEGTSPRNNN